VVYLFKQVSAIKLLVDKSFQMDAVHVAIKELDNIILDRAINSRIEFFYFYYDRLKPSN